MSVRTPSANGLAVAPNAPATANDPSASPEEFQQPAFWGRYELVTQLPNVGSINGGAVVGANPASGSAYAALRPGDYAYVAETSALYFLITRGTSGADNAEWALLSATRHTVIKAGLDVAASSTFFTVSGGRVRIYELFFRVTTGLGAAATTMKLSANVAGTDSDLCAASGALATLVADSILVVTGDPAAALLIGSGQGASRSSSLAMITNPCTIDSVIVGGTTGVLTGYCTWEAIDPGATLV